MEHVSPEVVTREHADVEHVRVREDEVRPLAHLPPLLARCVAVVDRRLHLRDRERREGARLVLRERLRRIEVDRAALRVGSERIEDRQVERERLAGRGSGGDDHVLARARRRPHLGLVRVQLVDALPCERGVHGGVELRRQRDGTRRPRRLRRQVGELFARKEVIPQPSRPAGRGACAARAVAPSPDR